MLVPNCLLGRCDSTHLGDRKCIYHFTPLAQRTVGLSCIVLTIFETALTVNPRYRASAQTTSCYRPFHISQGGQGRPLGGQCPPQPPCSHPTALAAKCSTTSTDETAWIWSFSWPKTKEQWGSRRNGVLEFRNVTVYHCKKINCVF